MKKNYYFSKKDLHFRNSCAIILKRYAPVAQLDRVTGYEPVGQGFESLPARQEKSLVQLNKAFFNEIRLVASEILLRNVK